MSFIQVCIGIIAHWYVEQRCRSCMCSYYCLLFRFRWKSFLKSFAVSLAWFRKTKSSSLAAAQSRYNSRPLASLASYWSRRDVVDRASAGRDPLDRWRLRPITEDPSSPRTLEVSKLSVFVCVKDGRTLFATSPPPPPGLDAEGHKTDDDRCVLLVFVTG